MPLKLKIRIKGHKKVINKLTGEFQSRLHSKITAALVEITQEAVTEAIPLAPRKRGYLRASIRGEVDPSRLSARILAGSNEVPYARYQEFGTYDNRIEEGDFDALRAVLKSGVGVKVGRGIAPQLFLHRGVDKALTRMESIFEQKISELRKELGF